jgi:DNA primase
VDLNDLSIVDAGDSQNYLARAKLMLSEGREITALLDGDDAGAKIEKQLKKVCASEIKQKKLSIHGLPRNKSSEDIFANLDALRSAVRRAYETLVKEELRRPSDAQVSERLPLLVPKPDLTFGKILDSETEAWFTPPEKISKLLIATLYEDVAGEDVAKPAPESALPELRKIKEILKLRGEKSDQSGVFEETK